MVGLTNDELRRKYTISPFGGINRSNTKHVYVLKINESSPSYDDRIHGTDFIYFDGQGQVGNHTFTRNNKGLAESNWVCHVWYKSRDDDLYHILGKYIVESWRYKQRDGRRVIIFRLVNINAL